MDKDTKLTLSEFSRRAMQRLEDKKITKTACLYIPSMDTNITVRSLTKDEILEITAINDEDDPSRGDKYCAYIATIEPDLRAVAKELQSAGEISDPVDVVEMLDKHELNDVCKQIMELSGIVAPAGKSVKVIEILKN